MGEYTEPGLDRERYAPQFALKEIGAGGQERIKESRVAIVGLGATGSVIADRLARAGVGFLRLVDRDLIEMSNLQRQFLYDEEDVRLRLPKVIAASRKLRAINSTVEIEACDCELNASTSDSLLSRVDLILDGTDNVFTRFLMNDYSVVRKVPWIYGGVGSTGGATASVLGESTACLRCIEKTLTDADTGGSCLTEGLLNTATAIIGALEATEAIRYLVERSLPSPSRLSIIDVWKADFRNTHFQGRPQCPCCGHGEHPYLRGDLSSTVSSLCGGDSFMFSPTRCVDPSMFPTLCERLGPLGRAYFNDFLFHFTNGRITLVVYRHGKVMVRGVSEEKRAKGILNEYLGWET